MSNFSTKIKFLDFHTWLLQLLVKQALVNWKNVTTLTDHRTVVLLIVLVELRGMSWKFLKRRQCRHFFENGYFSRKGLRFYVGSMMQGLLSLGPGQFPSVLPNPPLLIRERYLSVLLLGLGFLLPSFEINTQLLYFANYCKTVCSICAVIF